MKKTPPLLQVLVRNVPFEGLPVVGELTAADLDLPGDERQSCPEPFRLEARASLVSEGVLLQGTVSGQMRCRCDRCLQYYTQECAAIPVCHDYPPPLGETVDLTEGVRDDILLAFPQRLLCSPDCRGLCPECGQNLNVRECACGGGDTGSPVWGALDALRLPEADGKPVPAAGGRRRSGPARRRS